MVEPATQYLGVTMQQNEWAVPLFGQFLTAVRPARVIELGTARGGLALFLHHACQMIGAEFCTHDIADHRERPDLFEKFGINFIMTDIQAPETVTALGCFIHQPGLSVVLCDNGNKPHEVALYAEHLKRGDFIMAHDYAPTLEYMISRMRGTYWDWAEIHDVSVVEPVQKFGLVQYQRDEWCKAAWGCWEKS